MPLNDPTYPTTTSGLVSSIGSQLDEKLALKQDAATAATDAEVAAVQSSLSSSITALAAKTRPVTFFSQPGAAVVGSSSSVRVSAAQTVSRIGMRAVTAPAGSALVVIVKKNGATISTLTMPAGSTTEQVATPGTAFAVGDLLTVESTSVGSTTAATGVVVQVDF